MNLMEGLLKELNSSKVLLTQYERIGPAGMFGASAIKQDIDKAEKAMGSGDTIEMLRMYEVLKGHA